MSQPFSQSQDPQAARRPVRRIREHALRHHARDPKSNRVQKPLVGPGTLLLFAFMGAFGLYATGHLQQLDHVFDHLQHYGRVHNDTVVRAIVHYLPAGLVLSAAAVLGTLSFFALRDRYGRNADYVDQKTLKAALANVLRASVKRSSVDAAAEMAIAAANRPAATAPKAAPRPAPVGKKIDGTEAARLRRDAVAAATARAAAAGRLVVQPKPVVRRPLSDSMPTLPFNARVQRRNPRGTLPPQVAAALKAAASLPTR